jgi:hypothetical protein
MSLTLEQQIALLKTENEKLKKNASARYKVMLSKDGQGKIMLLGVRRFPLTFWPEEWKAIYSDEVKKQVEALLK